jgi:hypothetical protein
MNVSKGRLPSLYYSDGTEIPMTMNGIPIDITNDETARKLNQIRNFPASLVNEGLEVISKTINKHFIVKIERTKDTCLYGAIETFQEAKITLQNLLFAGKAKMISTIKDLTTNIVLTHKDALEMKESLTLNIAMLEQAEAKVNGSRNDEIVVAIVDNFWDYFRNNSSTSPDAVSLIALQHELRDDRSKGVGTELFTCLTELLQYSSRQRNQERHYMLRYWRIMKLIGQIIKSMQVVYHVQRAKEAGQKSVRLNQDHQALRIKAHLKPSSDLLIPYTI